MTEPTWYLLGRYTTLPGEEPKKWLGRVVTNYAWPSSNYAPELDIDVSEITGPVRDDEGYTNVSEIIEANKNASFHAEIAERFGLHAKANSEAKPTFKSPKVQQLAIYQHKAVFKKYENSTHYTDLKEMATLTKPLYLIVGVLVSEKISYSEHKSSELSAGGDATISASGTSAPSDPSISAGGEFEVKKTNKGDNDLTGKRVFAIQYCIIKKRLLSKSGRLHLTSGTLHGDRTFGEDNQGATHREQTFELNLVDETLEEELEDSSDRFLIFDPAS